MECNKVEPIENASALPARRGRGDGAAAVVEMAFVITILSVLLFGIIEFGYVMNFRQSLSQAAAEGARAGAVAQSGATVASAATAATSASIQQATGKTCGSAGMTCTSTYDAAAKTITVTVTYDYSGHPLMPNIPVVSAFLPGTITTSYTAKAN